MVALLKLIANIVNDIHDNIVDIANLLGLTYTDKSLHFWMIGFIGIVIFFVSDFFFKRISKWSISIISFIYTITVLIVLVFSLEIVQKLTGRGKMEFADIVAGLWGFIVMFVIYLAARMIILIVQRLANKYKEH